MGQKGYRPQNVTRKKTHRLDYIFPPPAYSNREIKENLNPKAVKTKKGPTTFGQKLTNYKYLNQDKKACQTYVRALQPLRTLWLPWKT